MKINDKSKQYFSQNITNPRGCRETPVKYSAPREILLKQFHGINLQNFTG